MKLKANTGEILRRMEQKGIRSKAELAANCGLTERNIYMMFRRNYFSKETLYLISDALGCTINDIVVPDWSI